MCSEGEAKIRNTVSSWRWSTKNSIRSSLCAPCRQPALYLSSLALLLQSICSCRWRGTHLLKAWLGSAENACNKIFGHFHRKTQVSLADPPAAAMQQPNAWGHRAAPAVPHSTAGTSPVPHQALVLEPPAKVQHVTKSREKDLLCSCLEVCVHLAFSVCWHLTYLGDLLPAALGRQPPQGSVALVVKTNVFYHPFHHGMKAQTEITQLLPWWAAGKPLSLPQNASTWGCGDWQNEATAPLAEGCASWRPAATPALLSVDGGSHTWGYCTQKPSSQGFHSAGWSHLTVPKSSTKLHRQGGRHAAWAAKHGSREGTNPTYEQCREASIRREGGHASYGTMLAEKQIDIINH